MVFETETPWNFYSSSLRDGIYIFWNCTIHDLDDLHASTVYMYFAQVLGWLKRKIITCRAVISWMEMYFPEVHVTTGECLRWKFSSCSVHVLVLILHVTLSLSLSLYMYNSLYSVHPGWAVYWDHTTRLTICTFCALFMLGLLVSPCDMWWHSRILFYNFHCAMTITDQPLLW